MLVQANALHLPLRDESVQCMVTSPPYYGLRNYGIEGQIGLEKSYVEYVETIVNVFREVRRVLKCDGTVWLNIGDSFTSWKGTCVGLKPKDLIGVPWRVAFALQQPYAVPTCVKREIDRAWLAAMFDGEGCIGIRRFDSYREEKQQVYQDGFVAYTVVTNNDIALLDRCAELTGFGKPTLKQAAESTDGRGIVSRRDSYGWRLDGNKAIEIVTAIYPYLIAKRRQACLVYTLDRLNKNGHGSRAVPTEVQEKKRALYDLIKRCNQRDSVDLPSWVEEPQQIVDPGWYLRSDIIWAKKNCMPESVTDRPTRSHEYLFLLTKSARYYYDAAAIRTPAAPSSLSRWDQDIEAQQGSSRANGGGKINGPMKAVGGVSQRADKQRGHSRRHDGFNDRWDQMEKSEQQANGANARSVWTIATQPYSGAHFATFPEALVLPCILAGSRSGDVVLDPFVGTGTVGRVCHATNRRFVGTDLSMDYLRQAQVRVERWSVTTNTGGLPLFPGDP